MRRRTATSPTWLPRMRADPLVGKISCISSLSVVLFPAPFGPEEAEDLARLDAEGQRVERAIRTRPPEANEIVLG